MEWVEEELGDKVYKCEVQAILTNDYEGTKVGGMKVSPQVNVIRKRYRLEGKPTNQTEFDASIANES